MSVDEEASMNHYFKDAASSSTEQLLCILILGSLQMGGHLYMHWGNFNMVTFGSHHWDFGCGLGLELGYSFMAEYLHMKLKSLKGGKGFL